MDGPRRAVVTRGWFAYLPGLAFDLYTGILLLQDGGCRATADSLQRLLVSSDLPALPYRLDEFDTPHNPSETDASEDAAWDRERWREFRADADRRGFLLSTPNDVLAFLCALGLIARDGNDGWSIVLPVPNLADALAALDGRAE